VIKKQEGCTWERWKMEETWDRDHHISSSTWAGIPFTLVTRVSQLKPQLTLFYA